jgi:hypothetical protein
MTYKKSMIHNDNNSLMYHAFYSTFIKLYHSTPPWVESEMP